MKKLIMPCINLKNIYLRKCIFVSETNELTCAIIASPEKEHKKLMILTFNGIDIERLEIILHPFVISMLPKNIPQRVPEAKLIKCSKLSKI